MLKSMFKMPKAPQPQQATPQQQAQQVTPTIDQAGQLAEEQNRMRRRKGRQQYMLNKGGDVATPTVGTKTLVGQ